MIDLMTDLEARMRPSNANLEEAAARIGETGHPGTPGAAMAIVPILFPGKTFGWWEADTVVENPPGAWPCENDDTYRNATLAATAAASVALGERPGTVGYVVVRRDGNWSVFEEILSPIEILGYARKEGLLP